MPFVGIFIILKMKKANRLKKFDWLDAVLILIYTFGGMFALAYAGFVAIASAPWWKILLVGVAADVIASVTSVIPIVGDFLGGILIFMLAFGVIGGLQGAFLGLAIMMISFIPAHIPGSNTLFMILFKLIVPLLIIGG